MLNEDMCPSCLKSLRSSPQHLKSQILSVFWLSTAFLFFIVIIVDAYIIVINNKERTYVPFAQFPPVLASYKTIVQYQNQDTDVETIHQPYSERPALFVLTYVHVHVRV